MKKHDLPIFLLFFLLAAAALAEEPGAVLRGQVRGLDSRPVAGAEVWVVTHRWSPRRGKIVYSHAGAPAAVTDADGRFALPDLQTELFSLHVCHPDFITWGGPVYEHDMKPDPMPVRLAPAIRIPGRVVDASGAAISGARVEARRKGLRSVILDAPCPWGGGESSALTDAEGRFTLGGLEKGSFVVTAELPGSGAVCSASLETTLDTPGKDLRLILEPVAELAGPAPGPAPVAEGSWQVVLPPGEETTLHGTVQGLQPDERALIEAFGPSGTIQEIAVGPDGTWRLEDIPTGSWMLELSTSYGRSLQQGLLAAGGPAIEVGFDLPRLVKVRGQVLGPDGEPVPCTELALSPLPEGKESCGAVSWNGRFLALVEPGLYHLSARASGLSAELATAVHAEIEPVDGIEIRLERHP